MRFIFSIRNKLESARQEKWARRSGNLNGGTDLASDISDQESRQKMRFVNEMINKMNPLMKS